LQAFAFPKVRVATKSYDKKKLSVQFPNALILFPKEKAKEKFSFLGRRGFNCPGEKGCWKILSPNFFFTIIFHS
jgi:hypothetical protein